MVARVAIIGLVTRVAIRRLQSETSDGGHCRTNVRVDRGFCRADARAAFVGI